MAMSKFTVDVRAQLMEGHNAGVYTGKIATLIGDVRVGRVILTNDGVETYRVAVPGDSVLHIEVDRQIDYSNNQRVKHLELFKFANGTLNNNHEIDHHEVQVNIQWDQEEGNIEENGEQEFVTHLEQPRRPVEIKMVSGHLTIVYTIGDEISFTEFIMALRSILADHPRREDIMDGHDFLNLSSTREHPLLARTDPVQPARWIHIKLVVEPKKKKKKTCWTTLLMRDFNLYVHGFINQQGDVYELLKNKAAFVHMLPEEYNPQPLLGLDVSYRSLLGAKKGEVIDRLMGAELGRAFAVKAVQVLSSYPDPEPSINLGLGVGEALAGLIFMVCESARMNPLHDSFAEGGWRDGTGFTERLMRRYVWNWGNMSWCLREWKIGNYNNLGAVVTRQGKFVCWGEEAVRATYLVLNDRWNQAAGGPAATKSNKPRGGGGSGKQSKKDRGGTSSRPGGSTSRTSAGGEGEKRGMAPMPDPGKSGLPSQAMEADDAQGHGRARVELLAMAIHPDLLVDGMKIVVFDGKRGQIIYIYKNEEEPRHQEDEGEKGMVKLVLAGPYRGISAEYGCFSIKIDIPSSGGDKHHSIKWEWDCDDPNHAAQVDTQRPAHHTIKAQDGSKVAEVTYSVMSDAREATVKVKFRLKGGHRPVGCKINAFIDAFDVPSVLFSCTEAMDQCLSSTSAKGSDDSWFLLQLARDVVAVPCSGVLKIVVALQIKTSNDQEVQYLHHFEFDANGICSTKTYQDDNGIEVQLNVSWYPEAKMATEVVYTIGDELSYTAFIVALRHVLADHPDREDILDRHVHSTREHPVLAKQRAEQPARWIHVKLQLQAVLGGETLSTTLIMRDDNLYVCGFMNQQGNSFELIENPEGSAGILPVGEYNPRRLSWGVGYRCLLNADTEDYFIRVLQRSKVGRCDFMMDAVHTLSRFPAWGHGQLNPRMALVGLAVMVCDSARLNPIYNFCTSWWREMGLHKFSIREVEDSIEMRAYYVFYYWRMSCELWTWKSKRYAGPVPNSQLQDIYLVLNNRLGTLRQGGSAESSSSRGTLGTTSRRRLGPFSWQGRRAGDTDGQGRPRVELLAMRADLGVVGTTIKVFDGKRGHIIYTKEEQGKQGMLDLVLTGPCKSISAYGCFSIKIDIPAASAGSSKGDGGGSIKWEWDCYDPEYADEVDKPPMPRKISSGPGRDVVVTYAVMSNSREATVQVKMRSKYDNSSCSVYGNITARIGDFKDWIILFRRRKGTGQSLSPTYSRVLQLARSVLAVPFGKQLHIKVDLQIDTYSDNQGPKPQDFKTVLNFANGISCQRRHEVDGYEVEVNITWYPDASREKISLTTEIEINPSGRQPDISYIVGDSGEGFGTFIMELRRLVADHPGRKDVLDEHPDPVHSSTSNHPVLPNGQAATMRREHHNHIEQARWLLHIKLHAGSGVEETPSITLVLRVDTLDIIGFQKQNGDWYDISNKYFEVLPKAYKSTVLYWGHDYKSILGIESWKEIMDIINSKSLGKTFAADAVSVLSRFSHTDEVEAGGDNPKLALVALMFMICESARINPVHDHIVQNWENGMELSEKLMSYVEKWPNMSSVLLDWKDHLYEGWPRNFQLEKIGINSPDDALDTVHLVYNDPERLSTIRW